VAQHRLRSSESVSALLFQTALQLARNRGLLEGDDLAARRAAFLAGLGAEVWSESDLARLWKLDREFVPKMSRDQADSLQARWRQAVDRSLQWERPDNQ